MDTAQLQTDALVTRVDVSLNHARSYLFGRQSPLGGFCFYRTTNLDEPNLSDTWHAVAALALLGKTPQHREALVSFVCSQPPDCQVYALHDRTFILHTLDFTDIGQDKIKECVRTLELSNNLSVDSSLSGNLDRMLTILQLKKIFDIDINVKEIEKMMLKLEHENGGFGISPNLLDTQRVLEIGSLCGFTTHARTRAFVSRLAEPSFAFRLTEYSVSPNLEIVCAGIKCCQLLQLSIAYPNEAAKFILACQMANGGFARAPSALPDICLTHTALQGLTNLLNDVSFNCQRPQLLKGDHHD
jgi:hypothetical protein